MAGGSKLHKIWIEQREATRSIRERYGLKAAFDYLVAEKLLNFSEAATEHPTFAQELPCFVAEVRSIFSTEELHSEIDRVEKEENARAKEAPFNVENDEFMRPKSEALAARAQRFAIIKSLLLSHQLGIS
jgi:hypothetical protein